MTLSQGRSPRIEDGLDVIFSLPPIPFILDCAGNGVFAAAAGAAAAAKNERDPFRFPLMPVPLTQGRGSGGVSSPTPFRAFLIKRC